MKTTNAKMRIEVDRAAELKTLGEDELRGVTGGTDTTYNAYYNVSTGSYILVPSGQVYTGPGLLVGSAKLNS